MAVQLEVFGFVDHTHPSIAELRDDAIVRDGLADHRKEPLSPGILGAHFTASQYKGEIWVVRQFGAAQPLLIVLEVRDKLRSQVREILHFPPSNWPN
jgi:hypothetical protein